MTPFAQLLREAVVVAQEYGATITLSPTGFVLSLRDIRNRAVFLCVDYDLWELANVNILVKELHTLKRLFTETST